MRIICISVVLIMTSFKLPALAESTFRLHEAGVPEINQALDSGAVTSETLVQLYERGLGEREHRPNQERAYRWAVAASQVRGASGIGNYVLGRCYRRGIGVEKNEASALRLYRESAKEGFILGEIGVAESTLLIHRQSRRPWKRFEF
jgi:hypothetical protein